MLDILYYFNVTIYSKKKQISACIASTEAQDGLWSIIMLENKTPQVCVKLVHAALLSAIVIKPKTLCR